MDLLTMTVTKYIVFSLEFRKIEKKIGLVTAVLV